MTIGVARTLLAVNVCVGARVGGIHLDRGAVGSAVVGQGKVNLTVVVVHRTPFRTVHRGGAHGVCSQPCIDQHVGLVGKAIGGIARDFRVVQGQFNPLTAAVGVEACRVQTPFVEVFVTGSHAAADVRTAPIGRRDKLVDVLVARVAAHVEGQRRTFFGQTTDGGFVGEAAHANPLGRH